MKLFPCLTLLALPAFTAEPFTVEANVVYGMYSGAALLLDVYKPAQPNGDGFLSAFKGTLDGLLILKSEK